MPPYGVAMTDGATSVRAVGATLAVARVSDLGAGYGRPQVAPTGKCPSAP